jgi:hypothetical protein
MPTPTQVRAAIKAKLVAIADIGVVHDYERYIREPSKLQALYVSGDPARLRGWHIRRISTREFLEDIARWRVVIGWRIRGFMAVDDEGTTEKTFDDLVEAIRDAFRADDDLGGLIFSCVDPSSDEAGVQLINHQPVLFCGVFCHHAELGLTTQHLN